MNPDGWPEGYPEGYPGEYKYEIHYKFTLEPPKSTSRDDWQRPQNHVGSLQCDPSPDKISAGGWLDGLRVWLERQTLKHADEFDGKPNTTTEVTEAFRRSITENPDNPHHAKANAVLPVP